MHKDNAKGIEAARREVFPRARPCNDFAHVARAVHSHLQKICISVETRDRVEAFLRETRFLPTIQLHSAVWAYIFSELSLDGWTAVVSYLQQEYFRQYDAKALQKAFRVHVACPRSANFWFGPHWCGVLGTLPGSGSGSQCIESFHALWQRALGQATKTSFLRVLPVMQQIYTESWAVQFHWGDQADIRLWTRHVDHTVLNSASLRKEGRSTAVEFWQNREQGNHVNIREGDTDFYVMHTQASDGVLPALRHVRHATASVVVRLIMADDNVEGLLGDACAGILRKDTTSGRVRVHRPTLRALFNDICVVMVGSFPQLYWSTRTARDDSVNVPLCTCQPFVARANCEHAAFVKGLRNEIDLATLPLSQKKGRPKRTTLEQPDAVTHHRGRGGRSASQKQRGRGTGSRSTVAVVERKRKAEGTVKDG